MFGVPISTAGPSATSRHTRTSHDPFDPNSGDLVQDFEGHLLRKVGVIEATLVSLDDFIRSHTVSRRPSRGPSPPPTTTAARRRRNPDGSSASHISETSLVMESEDADTQSRCSPKFPTSRRAWGLSPSKEGAPEQHPVTVTANVQQVWNDDSRNDKKPQMKSLSSKSKSFLDLLPRTSSRATASQAVDESGRKERIAWNSSRAAPARNIASRMLTQLRMTTELEVQEDTMLYKIVHGAYFSMLSATAIVTNSMFIGYNASIALQAEIEGTSSNTWTEVVEGFFVVFFVLELILRLLGERALFFTGHEWKWNMFDVGLVLLSLADVIVTTQDRMNHNLSAGRLLRLIRFFRLMRLTRVLRIFANLRLMLFSIIESMSSLFWCFTVIGLALYVFAILFLNVATLHFHGAGPDAADKTSEDLKLYFGSLYKAMVTLFMTITGGVDWFEVLQPLTAVHGFHGLMFFFYVFVMQFGILNVVVGTFVASAQEIASKDREAVVKFEMKQHQVQTQRMKAFFDEADSDKSGTLSWEEFEQHLSSDKMKAYFQAMELDVSMAHELFELLDVSGENQVTIDEFLEGCMRLKGHARSTELNMLVHMCKKVFKEMVVFMDWSEAKLDTLQDQVVVLMRGG